MQHLIYIVKSLQFNIQQQEQKAHSLQPQPVSRLHVQVLMIYELFVFLSWWRFIRDVIDHSKLNSHVIRSIFCPSD